MAQGDSDRDPESGYVPCVGPGLGLGLAPHFGVGKVTLLPPSFIPERLWEEFPWLGMGYGMGLGWNHLALILLW